jgi:integrase
MVGGRRVRKAFETAAQAEAFIRECESTLVLGIDLAAVTAKAGKTIGDAFERTRDDCWSGKKSQEALTRQGEWVVEFFGADTLVSAIDEVGIQEMVSAMRKAGKANGTINRRLAALSKMLTHAQRLRMVDRKPLIAREREPVGRIRYLTSAEEKLVIDKFRYLEEYDFADLCLFLVETGARCGEVFNIQWRDVNGRLVSLWDTKNKSSRSVPLTGRAADVLERRKNRPDGPFVGLNHRRFNRCWDKVKVLLGMGDDTQLVPHALRHTCALRLARAGTSVADIKDMLGHKTLSVTVRYAKIASVDPPDDDVSPSTGPDCPQSGPYSSI